MLFLFKGARKTGYTLTPTVISNTFALAPVTHGAWEATPSPTPGGWSSTIPSTPTLPDPQLPTHGSFNLQ